jgi:hypothetical protein
MDATVWDASTFSKNRDRLLEGDVARGFLAGLVARPRVKALMLDEHFSVDGTLIQAWAGHKSFQPKAGPSNPDEPPGPDTRAGATPSATGEADRGATRRMRARPIRTRAWHASRTDSPACSHHPPFGLRRQPTHTQAYRVSVWLGQILRRAATNPIPGPRTRQVGLQSHGRRLQPHSTAETTGRRRVR